MMQADIPCNTMHACAHPCHIDPILRVHVLMHNLHVILTLNVMCADDSSVSLGADMLQTQSVVGYW